MPTYYCLVVWLVYYWLHWFVWYFPVPWIIIKVLILLFGSPARWSLPCSILVPAKWMKIKKTSRGENRPPKKNYNVPLVLFYQTCSLHSPNPPTHYSHPKWIFRRASCRCSKLLIGPQYKTVHCAKNLGRLSAHRCGKTSFNSTLRHARNLELIWVKSKSY
jgi:hypothetical protein